MAEDAKKDAVLELANERFLEALKLWPQTTTLLSIYTPLFQTHHPLTLTPHPLTLHSRPSISDLSHPTHSPSMHIRPPISDTTPTYPPHTAPLLDVPSHADCALCCRRTLHGSKGHEPFHYRSPCNCKKISWKMIKHRWNFANHLTTRP